MNTKLEMTLSLHSNISKAQTTSRKMRATMNNDSSTTEPPLLNNTTKAVKLCSFTLS